MTTTKKMKKTTRYFVRPTRNGVSSGGRHFEVLAESGAVFEAFRQARLVWPDATEVTVIPGV